MSLKLRAAIVDDQLANIDTLSDLISMYCPSVEIVGTAVNIETAYELILLQRPHLTFLDVRLDKQNGFDLLGRFSQVFFDVVFTTAYNQYATDAFRENALDYLMKPIRIVELQQAVEKAMIKRDLNVLRQNSDDVVYPNSIAGKKISLPTLEGCLFVNIADIIRCEAAGSYTIFFLKDGRSITVSFRLKIYESKLPSHLFFRVHHSHLINLDFVTRYTKGKTGAVYLLDGTDIEVAASKKEAFMHRMTHR